MAIISVKSVPADLTGVVLRDADEAECRAGGMTGAEAIAYSAAGSIESFMVEADGVPVAYWGYCADNLLSAVAQGWLLTTPEADKYRIKLARASQRIVAYILEKFPRVVVNVHQEHTLSCKWLEWLGFHYQEKLPNGFYIMTKWRT